MLISFQQYIMNTSLKDYDLEGIKAEVADFVVVFKELQPGIYDNL